MINSASLIDIRDFLDTYGNKQNDEEKTVLDLGCSDGQKVLSAIEKEQYNHFSYVGLDSIYWQ
jgi:cyclopropane fatty-acyl-phospholipid synthase-like methyltransferase